MADIIKFEPRQKPENPSQHILELHVYQHAEDKLSGVCSSDCYDYGTIEGRLNIAATLERMAWLVRKACADEDAQRGDLLAVASIYSEGFVSVRVDDDKVQTEPQFEWLDGMLDTAKDAARTWAAS